MDRFFSKVNQKVNVGQHPTPDAHPPGHRYFIGPILKNLSKNDSKKKTTEVIWSRKQNKINK